MAAPSLAKAVSSWNSRLRNFTDGSSFSIVLWPKIEDRVKATWLAVRAGAERVGDVCGVLCDPCATVRCSFEALLGSGHKGGLLCRNGERGEVEADPVGIRF